MLRRLDELLGLRLRATDGDIGRVHDLYFDDQSPGVDTDKPVARQNAVLFRECDSLPYYWAIGGPVGQGGLVEQRPHHPGAGRRPAPQEQPSGPGIPGAASDGEVGHVDGFLVDDVSWALRCIVVSMRHRASGTRVLVPADWIGWVSWIERALHVDLRRNTLLDAPAYDPSRPVSEVDEARLRAIYGRDRTTTARRSS